MQVRHDVRALFRSLTLSAQALVAALDQDVELAAFEALIKERKELLAEVAAALRETQATLPLPVQLQADLEEARGAEGVMLQRLHGERETLALELEGCRHARWHHAKIIEAYLCDMNEQINTSVTKESLLEA